MQLNTAYYELLAAIFNVNGTGDNSSLLAAFSTFTTQCSQNPPEYGFLTYATSVFTPDGAPFPVTQTLPAMLVPATYDHNPT